MNIAFVDDAKVTSLLDFVSVRCVLEEAFGDLALGNAAVFPRTRTDCGPAKLSAMGALWISKSVAGIKSYPTIDGKFSFLISLFDLKRNYPIAILQANEITRLRTAAIVSLVAQKVAPKAPAKLALFGFGIQGRAALQSMAKACSLLEVCVVDPAADARVVAAATESIRCPVRVCSPQEAVEGAAIVITATRSKTPVFKGEWLAPGAYVAAVGTSLPNGAELDDRTLGRAGRVIVEWKPQSVVEAGEVALGLSSGALDLDKVIDLPELYRGQKRWRAGADEIVVFKTVGIGLSDIATAWLATQRLALASAAAGGAAP